MRRLRGGARAISGAVIGVAGYAMGLAMPRHDFLPRLPRLPRLPGVPRPPGPGRWSDADLALFALAMKRRGRRKGKDPEAGGVPVEPDRPDTLSGGAAAALEWDE